MDIVIYTNKRTLEHKRGGDGHRSYYWHFTRPPKRLSVGERIYFAVGGVVVGSFKCDEINNGEETVCWNKNSWEKMENSIPTTHFQGFKYKWW